MLLPRFLTQGFLSLAVVLITVPSLFAQSINVYQAVKAQDKGATFLLSNGTISLTIDKKSANIDSIQYDGLELGLRRSAMYFDCNGAAKVIPEGVKVPRAGYYRLNVTAAQLAVNTPDEAEVILSSEPTKIFPFHIDVHYALHRGDSGFYAYAVFHHGKGMPAGGIGQSRFVIKGVPGTKLFTDHIVDDARKGPFPTSPAVRAVSDATFLLEDNTVYTKYNTTVFMANHHVHGMTGHNVGLWMVTPSNEYVNGGPLKQELTVHMDNVLLCMLEGGHYGAAAIDVANDEEWNKFYGPFFVYCNHGPDMDAMYQNAKHQAAEEQKKWPYQWVNHPDYPLQRTTVTGKVNIKGGVSSGTTWVILASENENANWAMRAKGYQFWTHPASNGSFRIEKVRPGSYTLFVCGANQFEEYQQDGIHIPTGKPTVKLADILWTPKTHGAVLWQIGIADRSTEEFRNGNDVRHFENFKRYPQDFPDDITYYIHTKGHNSTPERDWNFAQWSWYCKKPYWSIIFPIQSKPQAKTATLTFGIAASNPIHGKTADIEIKVNGNTTGVLHLPKSGAAAYRSGGQDSNYRVETISFDASLLKQGENEITLGFIGAAKFPAPGEQAKGGIGCVMYDAIRLEL